MNALALRRGLQSYTISSREADVDLATPHRLVQALYEGALTGINIAKGAALNGNLEVRSAQTTLVLGILTGLMETLNLGAGGNLAQDLYDLYAYMQKRLFEAVSRADISAYDEVSRLLREIKAGWDAIPQNLHHGVDTR
jgi:flagellar protein FliS